MRFYSKDFRYLASSKEIVKTATTQAPKEPPAVAEVAGPAVTLVPYHYRGAAPVDTAEHTHRGPAALMQRIVDHTRVPHGEGVRVYDSAFGAQALDFAWHHSSGTRNLAATRDAIATQFKRTAQLLLSGSKVIGLGGDHSMAIGSIQGFILARSISKVYHGRSGLQLLCDPQEQQSIRRDIHHTTKKGDMFALVQLLDDLIALGRVDRGAFERHKLCYHVPWLDAHYDMNTGASAKESPQISFQSDPFGNARLKFASPSPSGNIHGMALAVVLGSGPKELLFSDHLTLPPSNIGFFGVRDGDALEEAIVKALHVPNYPVSEIQVQGLKNLLHQYLSSSVERTRRCINQSAEFFVQLDIDFLDAPDALPTGTPVGTDSPRNPATGPELENVLQAMENLMAREEIFGADIAELAAHPHWTSNPAIDSGEKLLWAMTRLPHERI